MKLNPLLKKLVLERVVRATDKVFQWEQMLNGSTIGGDEYLVLKAVMRKLDAKAPANHGIELKRGFIAAALSVFEDKEDGRKAVGLAYVAYLQGRGLTEKEKKSAWELVIKPLGVSHDSEVKKEFDSLPVRHRPKKGKDYRVWA